MKSTILNKEEILKVFEETISDLNSPTYLDLPYENDFSKVNSYSTELAYEKCYDEEVEKIVYELHTYYGSNGSLNEALTPLFINAENPREVWIECAMLLFMFLKDRAIEAIADEEYLLAIGLIESLDSQAYCIDQVIGGNTMQNDAILSELKAQQKDIEDICPYEIYEGEE